MTEPMTDASTDPTAGEVPVRVLVVDDQRVVREGLQMLLGLLDTVAVAGTAADGQEALDLVQADRPDVVLMDLHMPRVDGIEATRRLAETAPGLPVVVLTTYSDDERVLAALQAGARGFLTKDAGAAEIEKALLAAARGQGALAPEVQRVLLEALRTGASSGVPTTRPGAAPAPPVPPVEALGLTARELDVVRLIATGLSNAEIAQQLFVSTATVKTHINHVFAKTNLRDRAQLVAYAFRAGLTDEPYAD
jgi:DNA-binding NarL/FixJ family response regulator